MPTPIVDAFVIDEDNEEKVQRHGLSTDQVLQVLDGPHRIKRNRSQRRASYLVIGRDYQDQCIAIPIEPTHDPRIWRPVTAWPCKLHEWSWLP
jgi:uncharacterized DUF497 family protein